MLLLNSPIFETTKLERVNKEESESDEIRLALFRGQSR